MVARSSKKKTIARRSRSNPAKLLTSRQSPLAKADLRAILSNPLAWESLDAKDRKEVLALFPDRQHIIGASPGSPARPNIITLLSDDGMRKDCTTYVENIAAGRHEEGWLSDAWEAHERRTAGDFDDHLDAKFERDWGAERERGGSSEAGDSKT